MSLTFGLVYYSKLTKFILNNITRIYSSFFKKSFFLAFFFSYLCFLFEQQSVYAQIHDYNIMFTDMPQ